MIANDVQLLALAWTSLLVVGVIPTGDFPLACLHELDEGGVRDDHVSQEDIGVCALTLVDVVGHEALRQLLPVVGRDILIRVLIDYSNSHEAANAVNAEQGLRVTVHVSNTCGRIHLDGRLSVAIDHPAYASNRNGLTKQVAVGQQALIRSDLFGL